MLFPMLTAEWLQHQVLYFSAKHHNFRRKNTIMFRKYFVDIGREAWLNLFWEYINGKLSRQSYRTRAHSLPAISESLFSMEYSPWRLKIAYTDEQSPLSLIYGLNRLNICLFVEKTIP